MLKSWTEVYDMGLGPVIEKIRDLNHPFLAESLVRLLVERSPPRLSYTYLCNNCGTKHHPERVSEEASYCPSCFAYRMTYTVSLSPRQPNPTPHLHERIEYLRSLLGDMASTYFKRSRRQQQFDCGYTLEGYYAKFASSDKAFSPSPLLAVLKSALLTPFLFDFEYRWGELLGGSRNVTAITLLHLLSGS